MPVSIPNVFVPGAVADAIQVNQNFDSVAAKFDGAINDTDISPTANINGTKIAPGTIPGGRIQAGTIGPTQVGSAPNGLNTINYNDASVTRAKVSTLPNFNLVAGNLDLLVTPITISGLLVATTVSLPSPPNWSNVLVRPYFTTSAGVWQYTLQTVWVQATSASGNTLLVGPTSVPAIAATRVILGWVATSNFAVTLSAPNYTLNWTFNIVSIGS